MTINRTGSLAAALALTVTTVAAAPAHATPTAQPQAPTTETAHVQYIAQPTGSASGGSLENEFVQAGLLIVVGVGVSALLAVGAGVGGGAIDLPEIPGLPF